MIKLLILTDDDLIDRLRNMPLEHITTSVLSDLYTIKEYERADIVIFERESTIRILKDRTLEFTNTIKKTLIS